MLVGLRGGLGQKRELFDLFRGLPVFSKPDRMLNMLIFWIIVTMKENDMDLDEILRRLQGRDLLSRVIKVERLKTDQEGKGLAKITISAERVDADGTTERLFYAESSLLSCNHVGQAFSVCDCGSSFSYCKDCASSQDNRCLVCSKILCDSCRAPSLFHAKTRYHKKCRWRFILNSLFGR